MSFLVLKPIIQSNQPSHRGICCQSPSALHWYTRLLLPSGNRCPGRHVIFTLLSVWFNVATALSTSGAGRHRPAVHMNTMYSTQRIRGTVKAIFHYASWFGAGSEPVRSQITLCYLDRTCFEQASNQLRTSFEPAPNQLRTGSEMVRSQLRTS